MAALAVISVAVAFALRWRRYDFPAGLKFTRLEEGLVFTTAERKAGLLHAEWGARAKACEGCDANPSSRFSPPALAKVSGDWSIVDAGAGRRQFAFKGKPLFAAPESLKEYEIAEAGEWELVVLRKGPGRPPQIGTQLALIGDVYTDKAGLTLYTFNCDSPARDGVRCDDPGDPAGYWVALCGDAKECARRWRPYLASPTRVPWASGQSSMSPIPCSRRTPASPTRLRRHA